MTNSPDLVALPDPSIAAALEAVLLLADEPLPPQVLAAVVQTSTDQVRATCDALAAEYEAQGRGFVLARVAGGYRYQTAPSQDIYVERFVREGHGARLSAAALETLAVVAYKQPVSRHQVAEIRGVNVDGVMRTLRRRGYIAEIARLPGPGQAVLYGTTSQFLEHLGLDSLDDLPPLGEFIPDPDAVEAMERRLRVVPETDRPDAEGPSGHDQ
ncbi:MAG: SMC-Scp complex subunit ScpB [Acidimicrobiaceae bacterium]|nr:SMC-Scp complex subunit ScpB [Acidimicrobiaceae bacterium]